MKIINDIIQKSKVHKKRVSICGEMASDDLLSMLFLGMGADELSISYSEIDKLCNNIQNITYEEAKKLATMALDCDNIEVVRQILTGRD